MNIPSFDLRLGLLVSERPSHTGKQSHKSVRLRYRPKYTQHCNFWYFAFYPF